MYYTWILSIFAGVISSMHSGGSFLSSAEGLIYFIIYTILAIVVGSGLDSNRIQK